MKIFVTKASDWEDWFIKDFNTLEEIGEFINANGSIIIEPNTWTDTPVEQLIRCFDASVNLAQAEEMKLCTYRIIIHDDYIE